MSLVFACKQVTNIADLNMNLTRYTPQHDTVCPSCGQEIETCHQILYCKKEGRVAALNCIIDLLERWLKKVGPDNSLGQVWSSTPG